MSIISRPHTTLVPSPAALARRRARALAALDGLGCESLVVVGDTEFNKHGYVRYFTGWRLYGGTGFVVLAPDGAQFVLGLGAQAEWAADACTGIEVRPSLDKIAAVADALCAATSPSARIAVAGLDSILSPPPPTYTRKEKYNSSNNNNNYIIVIKISIVISHSNHNNHNINNTNTRHTFFAGSGAVF